MEKDSKADKKPDKKDDKKAEKPTDKKSDKKIDEEKPSESPAVKGPSNFVPTLIYILKYTLLSSVVFLVVGTIVYLTLANLAFFGFLPSKVTDKMPIVNKIVKDIEAKEKRIKLAKELSDDKNKVQKAGELQIDLLEAQDVEGKDFVPFLYKLRVLRNRINNKELAEIWVDNVLVIKVYAGIGDNTPYARATYVVKKVNNLLNNKADFNQLMPVIATDTYKAEIMGEELFRVSEEDAILNNTTQIELLYTWVNNLRVSLGASLFQVPKFIVKQTDIPEDKKAGVPTPTTGTPVLPTLQQAQTTTATTAVATAIPTITDAQKLRDKQLKAVIQVYEKLPDDKVADILKKMNQNDLADILKYLSVKKTSKVLPLITTDKSVGIYRKMVGDGTDDAMKKAFKKYSQIWEKTADTEVYTILKAMKTEEKLAIFRKMTVKKKAKVLDQFPAEEAKKYLKLLEEPTK